MKKVATAQPRPVVAADGFVNQKAAPSAAPAEPMKRLSIDIPGSPHRRINVTCDAQGRKMGDAILTLLEAKFPADKAA
jgi:hypothetical protein